MTYKNVVEQKSTINELLEKLQELKEQGYGDFKVVCNSEYNVIADTPDIKEDRKFIDFGGWC